MSRLPGRRTRANRGPCRPDAEGAVHADIGLMSAVGLSVASFGRRRRRNCASRYSVAACSVMCRSRIEMGDAHDARGDAVGSGPSRAAAFPRAANGPRRRTTIGVAMGSVAVGRHERRRRRRPARDWDRPKQFCSRSGSAITAAAGNAEACRGAHGRRPRDEGVSLRRYAGRRGCRHRHAIGTVDLGINGVSWTSTAVLPSAKPRRCCANPVFSQKPQSPLGHERTSPSERAPSGYFLPLVDACNGVSRSEPRA